MSTLTKPDGTPIMSPAMYQRHIICDTFHKCIFIQVKLHGPGLHNIDEWIDITAGRWHDLVPKELRQVLQDLVINGFQVLPMHADFGAANKDYYILQYRKLETVTREENNTQIPFIKK